MGKIDINSELTELSHAVERGDDEGAKAHVLRIGLWFACTLEAVSHDLGRIADAMEREAVVIEGRAADEDWHRPTLTPGNAEG